ncbi:hypothetical protein RAZWK3B_00135 [Roseobacter sp. AzwK-3b]|nr:hypothetical protein RAZWK3B_00135 [Roseobacter sp. AzwK-3b]
MHVHDHLRAPCLYIVEPKQLYSVIPKITLPIDNVFCITTRFDYLGVLFNGTEKIVRATALRDFMTEKRIGALYRIAKQDDDL